MRKLLLSAALAAICFTASAQKLTYIPYSENGYLAGTVISPNGRYAGGSDLGGQAFIYDTENGQIKYFASPNLGGEDTEGNDADIRSINDNGVGIGYMEGKAAKFDFASGQYSSILDESSIAQFISNDGKFVTGFTYDNSYRRYPFWMVDGVKKALPVPTEKWLGYEENGFHIEKATDDGSIIIGSTLDNFASFPLLIWNRNAGDSTYSVSVTSKRFFDGSANLDGSQPYDWFEGAAISADGKWVAINLHPKNDYEAGMSIARFNVDGDSLELITCPDVSGQSWYYANGIANDGTIVGYIENQRSNGRKAIICKGGETEAKYMTEAFPTVTELATMDNNDLNCPCSITPDGRYIEGYGYVDYNETSLCYATYVLDTKGVVTAVDKVAANADGNKVAASYTADGKRISRLSKPAGVVINKFANGRVKKTFTK